MNAIKFIQDFGFDKAKNIVDSPMLEGHNKFDLKKNETVEVYKKKFKFVDLRHLKHLVESIDLIESLGGLCAALDAQYLEETEYLDNAVRIDAAIKDLRDWFKVGDVVVRKKGDDIALRKITGLFRDGCLAECDDGFSHHIVDIRHATLKEKSEGKRTEGGKA